jgi:hypothetical protein
MGIFLVSRMIISSSIDCTVFIKSTKAKVSLWLRTHHEDVWGVEVKLISFLTSSLDEVEWLA